MSLIVGVLTLQTKRLHPLGRKPVVNRPSQLNLEGLNRREDLLAMGLSLHLFDYRLDLATRL
jgi:hypothetical protein